MIDRVHVFMVQNGGLLSQSRRRSTYMSCWWTERHGSIGYNTPWRCHLRDVERGSRKSRLGTHRFPQHQPSRQLKKRRARRRKFHSHMTWKERYPRLSYQTEHCQSRLWTYQRWSCRQVACVCLTIQMERWVFKISHTHMIVYRPEIQLYKVSTLNCMSRQEVPYLSTSYIPNEWSYRLYDRYYIQLQSESTEKDILA